jgi:hypothetical protein
MRPGESMTAKYFEELLKESSCHDCLSIAVAQP